MNKFFILIFFLISVNVLMSQVFDVKESTALWGEQIDLTRYEHDSLYFESGISPIQYLFHQYPCFGLIFDKKGFVYYRDRCPGDYEITSKIGSFIIEKDTVFISSKNTSLPVNHLNKQYDLRFGAIKKLVVEDTSPEKPTTINFIDEQGNNVVYAAQILYYNTPRWMNLNLKLYRFNYHGIQKEPNKNIFTSHLLVSDMRYEDQRFDSRTTFFRIREIWNTRGKKITIQFWDKSIKIVREKNKTILYRWNWKKSKYEKSSKLVLNYPYVD